MGKLSRVVLILLLPLTTAMLLGFSTPRKIRELHPEFAQELLYAELDGQPVPLQQLGALEISPGSIFRVYLCGEGGASLFMDQEETFVPTSDVTMSRLRAAGIEAVVQNQGLQEGLWATASLGVNANNEPLRGTVPYLEIAFSMDPTQKEDITYSLEVSLSLRGRVQEQTALQIAGVAVLPQAI